MSTRMTLGAKLTVGFGVMLGLSSLLSLGALAALSALKDRFDVAVNQTARRIELASDINATQSNMFADQRGIMLYTFAKDAAHLDQLRQHFDRENRHAARVSGRSAASARYRAGQTIDAKRGNEPGAVAGRYQQLLVLANAGNAEAALALSREKVLPLHEAIGRAASELVEIQQSFLAADKEATAGKLCAAPLDHPGGPAAVAGGRSRRAVYGARRQPHFETRGRADFGKFHAGFERSLPGRLLQPVAGARRVPAGRFARRNFCVHRRNHLHDAQERGELAVRGQADGGHGKPRGRGQPALWSRWSRP